MFSWFIIKHTQRMQTEIKKKKNKVTFQASHFLGLTCQVAIHRFNLEQGVVFLGPEVVPDWLHGFSQTRSC